MLKRPLRGLVAASSIGLLAACGSTPYTPVVTQADPVDVEAYAPKVESFVVVMDKSSTMGEEYQETEKLHNAQDVVASFNAAVPDEGFKSGLVTFGKDCGSCWGSGEAAPAYGLASHQASDFEAAVAGVECAKGTSPMSEGVDAAGQLLSSQSGPAAVIIVSDFKWMDTAAVEASVANLKSQHGSEVCIHTVKVGDDATGDALISSLTAGCGSAVSAGDIASGSAMSAYVTETLMAPLQYEKHTVSATALFDFDKAVLKDEGKEALQGLGDKIKSQGMSVGDIDVVGHTDNIGSAEYNQELSVRRAVAVKEYIVSRGIDADIIDVIGKGKSDPVASNDTDEGRAQNRRVDIHVGTSRPMK